MPSSNRIRIAALADLHFTTKTESLRTLWQLASESADVLLLCGDLTDHGTDEESQALAADLRAVTIPMVGVLGNHDHESNNGDRVREILTDAGLRVLDGDACEVKGIGFAGVKGFAGGFGRRLLAPWGEQAIKDFVQVALDEALKLDSALARLRTPTRVALLHYAPIAETVEGEPLEIFPFLGSSRLEEPLNRHEVACAFHGHAHRGRAEGTTHTGIPVYNVSRPLLADHQPDSLPFRVVELPLEAVEPGNAGG